MLFLLATGIYFFPAFENQTTTFSDKPRPDGLDSWIYSTGFGPGGRKDFGNFTGDPIEIPGGGINLSTPLGISVRHLRTEVVLHLTGGEQGLFPVQPSSQYKLEVEFGNPRRGDMIWKIQTFSPDKSTLSEVQLTSIILRDDQSSTFAMRFLTDANTGWITPRFVFGGVFDLNLSAVKLYQISGKNAVLLP